LKKLSIIVALCAFVILILPKIFGELVKHQYQTVAAQFAHRPNVTVTNQFTDWHWFNGKAMTKIILPLGNAKLPPLTVVINDSISFGPLIWSKNGFTAALANSTSTFTVDGLPINPEILTLFNHSLSASTTYTFGMDVLSSMQIQPINATISNVHVAAKAMTVNLMIKNRKHVDFLLNWGGMQINTPTLTQQFGVVNVESHSTVVQGDIYSPQALSTGDFAMSLASVAVEAKTTQKKIMLLNNMLINGHSRVNKQLMSMAVNYKIAQANFAQHVIKDINLSLLMDNFSVEVLQKIEQISNSIPKAPSHQQSQQFVTEIFGLADELLAKKPTIRIKNFSLSTLDGQLTSDMSFAVNEALFNAKNPKSIFKAMNIVGNGQAPEQLLASFGLSPMIEQYVQHGFIAKQGGLLKLRLTMQHGQLKLNDKVLPY